MNDELVEKERLRIIQVVQDDGSFVTDADGFVYYWPTDERKGHLGAHHLRWIADELDRRNDKLNAEIEEYFRLHPVDDSMSETEFFD